MLAFQVSINFHRGLREARNCDSFEFIHGPCENSKLLVQIEEQIGKLIASTFRTNEWQFLKTFVTNIDCYISALEKQGTVE